MRRIQTKGNPMWRCLKSIKAIKKSTAERDAFGRLVSEINAEASTSQFKNHLATRVAA